MSKRIISTAVAAIFAMALAGTAAEARTESSTGASAYGSVATSSAKKKSYKSASKSRSSKKYGYKSKSKRRYASSGKRKRGLSGRSLVSYSSGGSSRSCLQSSARALLNRIESRFGAVEIISTCRAGATIATSGKPSKHRYGLAIDFSAGGRKAAVVQWLLANHHSGGTMTYRDMSHIHVDIGGRFVSLGANSGRG